MKIKMKAAKKRWRRGIASPRYWAAVGTLATYSALGGGKLALAKKDGGPADPDKADPTRALNVRRFDIAGGQLGSVLDQFEQTTGVHVDVAKPEFRTFPSPGVSGLYPPDQALRYLLGGTGLSVSTDSAGHLTIEIRRVSSVVDVNAEGTRVASPKFPATVTEALQSIDVVPKQVLEDQGVTTLRDALRNFAGISLAAGEGGSQGDNLTIRGFTARNDLFLDGMRDFGSYYRDPFDLQQVEVLQGPSSVTFGRGSTGGVVNQETKLPGLDRLLSADLQFGTNATRRATLDMNSPVPMLGNTAAFRLNVMGDIGDVAGRDVAENRRFGLAPSLALGLGTPMRLTLSYLHQTADDIPDYGIPWLLNGPAPVNRSNYYGLADGNYLRTYDDIGTLRLEHDFGPSTTLDNHLRYANEVRDVLITEPQVLNPTFKAPLASLLVNRHEIGVRSAETSFDEQLDLSTRFRTGFLYHTVVSGVEAVRETSDPTRPTYPTSSVPVTSLLSPTPDQQFTGGAPITSKVNTTALTAGVYLLDTVRFAKKWQLIGGFRFDHMNSDYHQYIAPVAAFSRIDRMPSWRAALSYSPLPNGNIYFSAGDSFNPSAETLSLSAGTANLPPEKNLSYEAGTKWDLSGGRLSLRTAVFRTDKTNARETDPTNSLLVVLAGHQRVDGIEAEVTGRLTSRWQVLTGYALLASKVVSSKEYPTAIGFPLANVPRNTANLWTTYKFPWRHLEGGAGTNFVDIRTASSTVPLDPTTHLIKEVPSYWTFSAMARFPVGEHMSFQINGNNLTNRYYYDELHPGHIVLGEGRTALIGIHFQF